MARVVGADLDRAYEDRIDDQEFQLGAEYEDAPGRTYVFGRYQDLSGADATAGLMAVACDGAYQYWDLTCDSNHGDANEDDPGGQIQAALSDGQCGFFQRTGPNRLTITTDGNVVQGAEVMVSNAARGIAILKTTNRGTIGCSRVADTATSLTAGQLALRIPRR